MKFLFVPGGSPATVFGLVPLARALRDAGHEVLMASTEDMMPVVTGTGIPGIAVTPHDIWHYITKDREGNLKEIPEDLPRQGPFVGRWFAQMGADGLPVLLDISGSWRPDLVVGGSMSYAAPLLAARLDIPYVRQAWDTDDSNAQDRGAELELQPELAELGLSRLPEPDLRIEICPPSLTPPEAPPAQLMRWLPGNLQRKLEPWMFTRGDRRRVCVTAGSRASKERTFDFLRALAQNIAPLDVEIVIPAPEALAVELRSALAGIRTGWIPLDVLAPTCDLVVHHAGGATTMTTMNAGVPHLIIPEAVVFNAPAQRIVDYGAALTMQPAEATPERVASAVAELLTNPSYTERARELSQEIARLPLPSEMVGPLEKLAAQRRG
ncbi:nucleotide disphospho-sugar-binding domain-containing protein [Streptomyces sp. NPDC051219]|uniref:nucleotide disphospho-sugar-binding domain-containing protein n=1 Tax=Streptomyces sp. NPDC051219 TaxID=3155283 RepID=UPI00341D82F2